jgi:hypothetical protein
MTLPGAKCRILGGYKDVLWLNRTKPSGPVWLVISGNKAKMASSWIPAYRKKSSGILHCPTGVADLQKHQTFCKNCSQALFQWTFGELLHKGTQPSAFEMSDQKYSFDFGISSSQK